jgi:transcription elongation factor/antiterminator RfaH
MPSALEVSVPAPHLPVWPPQSLTSEYRWYAAYTKSRHEKYAELHLRNREVETFLPISVVSRRRKDRRTQIQLPLFPGYLFVRISSAERLRVLQAPGIVELVNFGGVPVPLADFEIENVRRCLCSEFDVRPHPYLTRGRRVRIEDGPLRGVEGTVLRTKGKTRLILSVDLIQKSVCLDVKAEDVLPVR